MLNTVILMGRLTADPELRTTTSGTSVTSFTIAVDRNYVKSGEDRQTDFINLVAWRTTAEFIERNFRKGQMIAIRGSMQQRTYEDKNGNKRTAIDVVMDEVHFCGDKAKPTEQQAEQPTFTIVPDNDPFGDSGEERLPF